MTDPDDHEIFAFKWQADVSALAESSFSSLRSFNVTTSTTTTPTYYIEHSTLLTISRFQKEGI